jgi:DNA-directed RNA polymerase specialized sigma24 family protein
MLAVTPEEINAALRGSKNALRKLIDEIAPVVEARASRVARRAPARLRESGYEHADLVQESFVRLFANGGGALLQWRPERGLSLRNWTGMIVERTLLTLLRSTRPCLEYPELEMDLDALMPKDPTALVEARSELRRLAIRAGSIVPERRLTLLARLCFLRENISQVARDTGLSEAALYAARKRMDTVIRQSRHRSE